MVVFSNVRDYHHGDINRVFTVDFICWIAIDILNLLNETKLNYWFKHLLNCNNSEAGT